MASPRILFVYHRAFLPYEGRYLRIYNQAMALVGSGWEVHVLACDRTGEWPAEEQRDGIQIHRIKVARNGAAQGPRSLLAMIRYMIAIQPFIMRSGASVVQACNLDGALPAWRAARRLGLPCILDLCEPEYCLAWPRWLAPVVWLFRRAERFLARRYDAVVVHNDYQIAKFRKVGVSRIQKVGSYPRRMAAAVTPPSASGNTEAFVVGRIGSIYEDNGIEELLAAFAELRRLGSEGGPTYKLLLAGRVFDSYAATFEELTAGFGEELEVRGRYTPDDLPALYGAIGAASLLYRRSPFFANVTPTKLFESMACGVPVIGSDIGEVRAVVEDADCGVIVDEQKPAAVAAAIHRLACDPERRARMGQQGLAAASSQFCFEVYEPGYRQLCHELLGTEGAE